jgi:Metallo-peptidase family M12
MNCLSSKSPTFSDALRITALGGLLVLLAGPPVLAQTGPQLWQTDQKVMRGSAVQVDVGRLRSTDNARFSLVMPDGRTLNVTKSGERETPEGLVWLGKIVDEPGSSVSFSVLNDTVVGSILTERGQSFRLRRDASGAQVIEEVDLQKLPPEGEPAEVPQRRGDIPPEDTCTTDGPDRIDVMVVYTQDALAGATNKDAMVADIHLAVAQSNQSYINSKINQRLRLVHIEEVSYEETGDTEKDRNRLKSKTGVDNVHTLRDTHGADVVVMITETGDFCGMAYIMDPVGNYFEDSAFAVVVRECMTLAGKYSFPHELGHIMSARHDWNADPADTPYRYGHGHIQVTPSAQRAPWRTIMAYDSGETNPCVLAGVKCPRVLNWSNPNVVIGGDPTGITRSRQPEDNHRVLNNTAGTVANFRCSKVGGTHCKGHFHEVFASLENQTEARLAARTKWAEQVAAHDGPAWNKWSLAADRTNVCTTKPPPKPPPGGPVEKPEKKLFECQARARPCR